MSTLGITQILGPTVRDGNDVGRLKSTAHLVVIEVGVLAAIVAVDSAKEISKYVVVLVSLDLEQGGTLGVDDGVGHVKVQQRLAAGILGAVRGSGTVDQIQLRAGTLGNIGSSDLIKVVEVLLRVDIAKGLVDSEAVGNVGSRGLGDLVEVRNAVRGDSLTAYLEVRGEGRVVSIVRVTASAGAGLDGILDQLGIVLSEVANRLADDGVALGRVGSARVEFCGGGDRGEDKVDDVGQIIGQAVLVDTNVLLARALVTVDMVSGL